MSGLVRFLGYRRVTVILSLVAVAGIASTDWAAEQMEGCRELSSAERKANVVGYIQRWSHYCSVLTAPCPTATVVDNCPGQSFLGCTGYDCYLCSAPGATTFCKIYGGANWCYDQSKQPGPCGLKKSATCAWTITTTPPSCACPGVVGPFTATTCDEADCS